MTDADKVIKASIAMENEVLLAIRQSIQSTEEGKYNVISRVSYKKIDLINLTGTFIATDKKMDVKTNLKSSYLEREIVAEGDVKYGKYGKSVIVLLKGKRGAVELTTSIEMQKINAGGKLVTILKTATIDYSFMVMLRNDAMKALHAVLNLDQKYELNAVVSSFLDLTAFLLEQNS
jgi:hypothetical protein